MVVSETGSIVRTAKCQCGAIEARCAGEPWRVSLGSPLVFERYGEDGGHWVRHYFCGTCGTALYHCLEQRPGSIWVAGGCSGIANSVPQVEVYAECALRGLNLQIEPKASQE